MSSPVSTHQSPYSPLFKIIAAWIAAGALAVGHHFFYAWLDGTLALTEDMDILHVSRHNLIHSQPGASAIGTAFAVLVSAFLGLSASTAFLQSSWRVVGQRAFTLSGLDALWSSPHNALAFLSFDLWRSARGIVIVSALAWTFPLVVTFAPGTLTVKNQVNTLDKPCSVPTFDFASSAILHEEVRSAALPYQRPSTATDQLVGSTLLAGQPFVPVSPCGANCSYLIAASALSFSCSEGTQNESALTWDALSLGFSSNPPPYVGVNLDVTQSQNQYRNWDFEAHYNDYTSWRPAGQGNNITCVAYNSTYHLHYTFAGSSASVTINSIVPQQAASQLSSNRTDGGFDTVGVHSAWFNATTNYYAILDSMYSYFIGNITFTQTGNSANFKYTPQGIALAQTPLIDASASSLSIGGNLTWISLPDIMHSMESLIQNISLSILTGELDRTQSTPTTCRHTDTFPHFAYNAPRLWLIYGVGLGVALFCDLFGVVALWQNAFGVNGEFSDFLAATRNRELNAVDLTKKDRVRLRYGPVRSEGGRHAFATPQNLFGSMDEVGQHGTLDKEEPFLANTLYQRRFSE
ncbi:hypothetical protein R3P38DRAFT_2610994 [Favolaschia claudopus]|uniref:Uncharacterized protein n=1 Tax=Favolaschia claudopus TaxID=2862362 RepID=A0AAW0CRQ8_9AGAR